ncbi:TauD/TfdA family dioxygenase [Acidovorax sp. CCYZU-2555]|nr:TauD/TfdA family dioxygenase [Acidovorax sp. CCYZU-2555]
MHSAHQATACAADPASISIVRRPRVGNRCRHEARCRHRWQTGDLIAWDNRCTHHLALTDYDINKLRIMCLTTLLRAQCRRRLDA